MGLANTALFWKFMRILLLADIHGNWPALEALKEPHDLCLCLGDLVDYALEPQPCVDWIRDHCPHCVRGNHDHGAAQDVIEGRSRGRPIGVSRWQAILVGLGEAAGAVGLLIPGRFDPAHRIVVYAAAWLAVLMLGAGIYHLRRRDSATPPVVLFLLSLLVVVGRWPG